MFDAIVVGVRAAGAPLAMNLAREGYSVLGLDRDTLPGPPRPAQALTGHAVHRIQRWGLLEALKATGTPPMWKLTMTAGEGLVELPFRDDVAAYCPRRDILDRLLVDAAREDGVEVREGVSVTGVLRDDSGRVTGVEGVTSDGTPLREEARIVIGADGRKSRIAEAVQARTYNELPGRTCCFAGTWRNVAVEGIEAYFLSRRAIIVYPTNDGITSVSVIFPNEEYERIKQDVDTEIERTLAGVPGLALRLRCGKHEGSWWGHRWPGAYYRDLHGPGWALAGDAGFLKDPILGQGINDAFRDADRIARAIHQSFSGGEDLDGLLQSYQEHRDEVTRMIYQASDEFAQLLVTPSMLTSIANYADAMLA
ncbi:MAG: FAD-dependent monooxygenase [Dehalococcoidia bacterium]|nr:FAD-dependent monooxygenase [Dehalococcoidia bacterium]